MKEWLENEIKKYWEKRLLGELLDLDIEYLQECNAITEKDKEFVTPIILLIANIAAAMSTGGLLGSATKANLKSVKSRLDTSAGHVFADIINAGNILKYIATSEGKDEHGDVVEDPLKKLEKLDTNGFGIAVDVVDGTTLAATGLNGAYTLSAGAFGLATFPDLQAYVVGSPKEVLDKFNFFNKPEDEALSLVQNLCEYYQKIPSELKIATSSPDKGEHHTTLIKNLEGMGVKVIIPNPVIVEPPYVLSMALRTQNAPDCIIGVLGLPEVVINTLLLATLNKNYELRFRIASNAMVKTPEQKDLRDVFKFQANEMEELNSLKLSTETIYDKEAISSNLCNACFSATAITNDEILGLNGYQKDGTTVKLETIFSGYGGNTLKIKTAHKCNNKINYAACFPQPIDDLSIILPVKQKEIVRNIEEIIFKIKNSIGENSIVCTPSDDLHITIYELGVHYGGFSDKECLNNAIKEARNVLKKFDCEMGYNISNLILTNDAVLLEIDIQNCKILEDLTKVQSSNEFFNVKRIPNKLHITVARLKEYVSKEQMDSLSFIVAKINKENLKNVSGFAKPELIHIISTPYTIK